MKMRLAIFMKKYKYLLWKLFFVWLIVLSLFPTVYILQLQRYRERKKCYINQLDINIERSSNVSAVGKHHDYRKRKTTDNQLSQEMIRPYGPGMTYVRPFFFFWLNKDFTEYAMYMDV